MTTTQPDDEPAPTERIRRIRSDYTVTALAAMNTLPALIERASTLLRSGRPLHITGTRLNPAATLYTLTDARFTGEPVLWENRTRSGFAAWITPGRAVYFNTPSSDRTEADVIGRYLHRPRRDVTRVHIRGGRPEDTPSPEDTIVITRWDSTGAGEQTTVTFTPEEL